MGQERYNPCPKLVQFDSEIELNDDKYEYAVCRCTRMDEGIRINKPHATRLVTFKCPRCGEDLGIFVRGIDNTNYTGFNISSNDYPFVNCMEQGE